MANICDMNLYIVAATGDDMKSLLVTMAANFEKVTNRDLLANVSELADWRTCANAMASGSDNYNKLCFLSGDPDSRSEYGSFSSFIASGKPCVRVCMGLKWGPSFQVESFCNGLDDSKYGFACINGGEYMCAMGDEIAYIQWGVPLGSPYDGGCEYDEYIAQMTDVFSKTPTTLHEIALRELFSHEDVGSFFWEHSNDYDEDGEGEGEGGYWGLPPINWSKPTQDDVMRIKNTALEVLAELPLVMDFNTGFTPEGNEIAESLLPGDEVRLSSVWGKDGPSALEVKTPNGIMLGARGRWLNIFDDYYANDAALGVLSLLLPHMHASIFELVPVSLRSKGTYGLTLRVRLDALPTDLAQVMDEAVELLKEDCLERELSTYVREAI